MFLRSVEIRGFKSFADKTTLSFNKGITAVVGPNGSGKSNISDAIRWVLGEQSVKSLRGGKMEDVIFAGTQFRKPIGLAQVALTLDNSHGDLPIDFNDVTISRRLYRSGESEYYINNTQCRLKDIQELFMDTGIGKEGYSIIGQGKIDAILSGKPEERRSLLEEAAGIVKFKTRKEESEKKLENTKQNLLRIDDILSTYEERLDPLKIESEKAKLFLSLSQELKDNEINIILYSLDKFQSKLIELDNTSEQLNLKISDLNNQKNILKDKSNKLRLEIEQFELKSKNQKQEYYNKKSEYQSIESESKILLERVQNLNNTIDKNNYELELLFKKLDDLKESKKSTTETLKVYKDDQILLDKNILECVNDINKINDSFMQNEKFVNELKDNQIKLISIISKEKNICELLKNEIASNEKSIKQLEDSYESTVELINTNLSTIEILESNASKIKEKINSYEKEISSKRNEISNINSGMIANENKLEDLIDIYSKLEIKRSILINSDKQFEGYNRAIKMLIQHIDAKKIDIPSNTCFILGEVITVKKELETAIEVALGGAISDIITTDEDIAKQLINYLKSNNLGRATFLPLNIVTSKELHVKEDVKNTSGYIGIASELIDYDNQFRKAVDYVLGRTILATTMDCALEISKKDNFNNKVVTLSGEIINPGGSLTGGSSYKRSINIISRKREIEELTEEMKIVDLKVCDLKSKIDNDKLLIKEMEGICLSLHDDIHHENIELTKMQEKIIASNNDTKRYKKDIETFESGVTDLKSKLYISLKQSEEKQIMISDLEYKYKLNSTKITEMKQELETKDEKLSNFRDRLTKFKIEKAQKDEIVNAKVTESTRLVNEITELNNKNMYLNNEISKSKNTVKTTLDLVESNKKLIENIVQEISKDELNFKEDDISTIKLNKESDNVIEELKEVSMIISKKDDAKHKYDISIAKIQFEIESLYKKLNDDYELTLAEALKFKKDDIDINEYKDATFLLKSKIGKLGVVNVSAIEEYKQIKDKYNFISIQKEDLVKAKEELLSVIEEMTKKMRVIFNENFEKLRIHFNDTFKELFKGGSADLILKDTDELTADIEINVQPPGKKLQNINLMSGGEKVLAAIALLFAILKMKPTPFCILDEIEASLDDSNVIRYSEFLKKFSTNIQFIVITHRKGTMEASDVLYGVTMEERGISKVVSVDLTN